VVGAVCVSSSSGEVVVTIMAARGGTAFSLLLSFFTSRWSVWIALDDSGWFVVSLDMLLHWLVMMKTEEC